MPVIEFWEVSSQSLDRDTCRMPHDSLLDNPEELAKLSGEVVYKTIKDLEVLDRD